MRTKKELIFALFFFVISLNLLTAELEVFSPPSSVPQNEYGVYSFVVNNQTIPLNIGSISSLSIKADFELKEKESYARIVLVDSSGREWQVFQAGFPFESFKNIENGCEETCILNPITPAFIKIEMSEDGTELFLNKIKYLPDNALFYAGTTPESYHHAQVEYKIETLNSKWITWTAGDSKICSMFYSEKKSALSSDGILKNLCGYDCYSGGIFEYCKSHEENTRLKDADAEAVIFNYANWHGEDYMTSAKDQAACGSCGVFGGTSAVEGVFDQFFNKQLNLNLAEQEIVSCCSDCCGTQGCCGGSWPDKILNYYQLSGVTPEECFPYTATNNVCTNHICTSPRYKISNHGIVSPVIGEDFEITVKKRLLLNGSMQAVVEGYDGGYWTTLHSVAISGYGYYDYGEYWIYKNSWGADWGPSADGYVKIAVKDGSPYFRYIFEPRYPIGSPIQRECKDRDSDSYCTWGIGSKPPVCSPDIPLNQIGYDCCSSQCSVEEDCDDSNTAITVCSEEQILCGDNQLVKGGETASFGGYENPSFLSCCGDDPYEFYSTDGSVEGCCNKYSDIYNGNCIPNPNVKLYSGENPSPLLNTDELRVALKKTFYLKNSATNYGQSEGTCVGCTYEWLINGILQSQFSGFKEISLSFEKLGSYIIESRATDSEGRTNSDNVTILNGISKISDSISNEITPLISEKRVLWVDFVEPGGESYLYDLNSKQKNLLYESTKEASGFELSQDVVVFISPMRFSNIFYKNLTSGIETQVTLLNSFQKNPAISGDIIVWEDQRSGNYDIYACNISLNGQTGGCLSTDTKIQITSETANQINPDIFGTVIVWEDYRNYYANIYYCNLDLNGQAGGCLVSDLKTVLTSELKPQQNPKIYGNTIVWESYTNNNWDIYMEKVFVKDSGGKVQITSSAASQRHPDIYGDYIVWEDERNGNSDIYYYSILESKETRLTSNELAQTSPSINSNKIVWQDEREGNADVFMGTLSTEPMPEDVNFDLEINVKDLALLTYWQGSNPSNTEFSALDINKDGSINWQDVLLAINKLCNP